MAIGPFWALGLAVAGIFISVVLSGVLAGLLSYGLIERVFRRPVQAEVMTEMLEESAARRGEKVSDEPALFLGLEPGDFYALPYRQLCGLLVARISADAAASASERWASGLAGYIVHNMKVVKGIETDRDRRDVSDLALNFVDRLQIRLSEAVNLRALVCSLFVLLVVFAALLVPVSLALSSFESRTTFISRSTDLFLSIGLAALLLSILWLSSVIVADLMFRWIDRVASSR